MIESRKKRGYNVLAFNYKPVKSSIEKFFFRISSIFRTLVIKKLVKDICKSTKDLQIDIILAINPTTIKKKYRRQILDSHPEAKKVLYLWDSVATYPIEKDLSPLFDITYSFDPVDCEKYGYLYRPTFYAGVAQSKSNEIQYDIFYIASYNKNRYSILCKMIDYCKKNNISIRYHLYIKNKLAFAFYKLFNPSLDKNLVSFELRNNEEKSQMILNSKAIFDNPLDTQTGLTRRIIEGMFYHKKILTTNVHIKDFDFYNPEDFQVIDSDHIYINKANLSCSVKYERNEAYYSVDSLMATLLGQTND